MSALGSKGPKKGGGAGEKPPAGRPAAPSQDDESKPVIRDRRKVDPISGQARPQVVDERQSGGPSFSPAAALSGEATQKAAEDEVVAAAELIAAREELAVMTEDLQRINAEYANYRKRVERDRDLARQDGLAEVLVALISVLDDIEAARQAAGLDGPFGAVATKLEEALAQYGLERYGAVGERFDPTIHEALMHQIDPEATGPTISMVLQPGYRMGERLLRPARVGVADAE
ncbi:MAG: nucleotide exchange factor GrpE [Micrococcales bacterium]|nr:nucleotide exchange factor GrpE [Micrococcales bacterium]